MVRAYHQGFAFVEYQDPSVTDMAIQGLHNFQLGDRTLVVQRSEVSRTAPNFPAAIPLPGTSTYLSQAAPSILKEENQTAEVLHRCMLLLNAVAPDELYDDQDYKDILEDITEECAKYGEIEGVRIPRPAAKIRTWMPAEQREREEAKLRKADQESGVGRVYVMYRELAGTRAGMKALAGRDFGGRTVLVAAVPDHEYIGPQPPPPPEILDAQAREALKYITNG